MTAILEITDGTTTFSLLAGERRSGFHLKHWRPTIVDYKAGGHWVDPVLASGRRPVLGKHENAIETFMLVATAGSSDMLIENEMQEIRRLFEKAWQYWTTNWQSEPVWIKAKADCETNARYAIIMRGRIPEDENPYSQPFLQSDDENVMDNLTLVVERGHWLSYAPGESVCVEASAREVYEFCEPCAITFPEPLIKDIPEHLNFGSAAAIDDLPLGDFTMEFWVRPGSIRFYKDAGGGGWEYTVYGNDVYARVNYDNTDAYSSAIVDIDESWHHVAITYSGSGANTLRFWIDGVEPAYFSQVAGIGVYDTDVANDFAIRGEDESYVGWMRLSNNLRYAANFIPPVRCTMPALDGNTIGLWIGAEGGGAVIDNIEGTAALDGAMKNALWYCDCTSEAVVSGNVDEDGNRDPTCAEQEVFIANRENRANLTDIWWWDASANSWCPANLRGIALPFYVLPNPVGDGDTLYFGIDSTVLDSGPFSSIVFDFQVAQSANPTSTAWEYYKDGVGWTALSCTSYRYDRDPLYHKLTGVESLYFKQPDDWIPCNPNPGVALGVTGFFIRCVITTAVPFTPAIQQNRDIYTITWPYIEIQSTEVLGDIPALLKIMISNESGSVKGGACDDLRCDHVIMGLRSLTRGDGFQSFLNLSTSQNKAGISVMMLTVNTAFVTDTESPTGTNTTFSANVQAFTSETAIRLDTSVVSDFYGIYHVYLRVNQTAGTEGDIGVRMKVALGDIDSAIQMTTEAAYTQTTGVWETLDLGQVTLPPSNAPPEIVSNIYLILQIEDSAGAGDLKMWDIVLIPVDEWAAEIRQEVIPNVTRTIPLTAYTFSADGRRGRYADIDSVTDLRHTINSLIYRELDDTVETAFRLVSNGPAILQANVRQRLYFFSSFAIEEYTYYSGTLPRCPSCEIAHSIQLFENQRYLSMRGSR